MSAPSPAPSADAKKITACGTLTAQQLGIPTTAIVSAEKSQLPKGVFVGKAAAAAAAAGSIQMGVNVKKSLANDIASITFLGLLNPNSLGGTIATGPHIPEIMVLGLRLAPGVSEIPTSVVELIAGQRKSGIVFAVVRDPQPEDLAQTDGSLPEQVSLVVRRTMPSKPGHPAIYEVFAAPFRPVDTVSLYIHDDATTMDEIWNALCAQIVLGDEAVLDDALVDAHYANVDDVITNRRRRIQLEAAIAELKAGHQRAKTQEKRNELFATLQKAKRQLDELQ